MVRQEAVMVMEITFNTINDFLNKHNFTVGEALEPFVTKRKSGALLREGSVKMRLLSAAVDNINKRHVVGISFFRKNRFIFQNFSVKIILFIDV